MVKQVELLARVLGGPFLLGSDPAEKHSLRKKNMGKVGRNTACPCGSGLKFKKCCGHANKPADIQPHIERALLLALEDDRVSRTTAVQVLRSLRSREALSAGQKHSIETALVQALPKIGDHEGALAILATMKAAETQHDRAMIAYWRARALERLQRTDEAVEAFEEAMPLLRAEFPEHYHFYLIEHGRAYSSAGQDEKAILAWKEAIEIFEQRQDNREHLARAKSNLGMLLLKSADPEQRSQGETLLYEMADEKALIGDLEGLTNNYSALSLHYMRTGRWERAIAFARRDLMITRLIGDEHQLCATLGNLAVIYIQTLQLSSARRLLEEARAIGTRLGHRHTLAMVKGNLEAAAAAGREAGKAGIPVGLTTPCACQSGQIFGECCGRADFEPVTPMVDFGESSNSPGFPSQRALAPSDIRRLDRVLDPDSPERFSWTSLKGHDGWIEVSELPDVASYHLSAARNLSENAGEKIKFDEPLAACLLSVCAAEAFINTVCFFISDTAKHANPHPASLLGRAAEAIGDSIVYQRSTELTAKWTELGSILGGPGWVSDDGWSAFVLLISIRNELVHFKAADYEQVAPAPKHPHEILRRLPREVECRDIPHSWPARLLTASFAKWCVRTVDDLINSLKIAYSSENRSVEPG